MSTRIFDIVNNYFDVAAKLPLSTQVTLQDGAVGDLTDGIEGALDLISACHNAGGTVRFIGNGGSATIASHMAVDLSKRANVRALAMNDGGMLTCLSNDLGYDQVFSHQLTLHGKSDDLLFAISSSGESMNIINGCRAASKCGSHIVTLSGFRSDNRLRAFGGINFFVESLEYGFVELTHMAILSAISDIFIGWHPNQSADR